MQGSFRQMVCDVWDSLLGVYRVLRDADRAPGASHRSLPLLCPYCGAPVWVFSHNDHIVDVYCSRFDECGADWDQKGVPTRLGAC
jgi:hypothetical protein